MPGRARTERFTGQHRHAMAVEQAVGERVGAESGFTDIDHHEHPAIGFQGTYAGAVGQAFTDQIAALAIGFTHGFQFRKWLSSATIAAS